jgi:pyruvate/2-oxoglutarate dehydrogenase complex dihydrolipoamide dehydrogenase (E3) component
MSQPEHFDALILGSGEGGKYLAWHMAQSGRRTAVVERRWIGGSCPNVNCLPSKNEIWSAKVAHLLAGREDPDDAEEVRPAGRRYEKPAKASPGSAAGRADRMISR